MVIKYMFILRLKLKQLMINRVSKYGCYIKTKN